VYHTLLARQRLSSSVGRLNIIYHNINQEIGMISSVKPEVVALGKFYREESPYLYIPSIQRQGCTVLKILKTLVFYGIVKG
jgi:hypothetical protein